MKELQDTRDLNVKLKSMVDDSNVYAVKKANNERNAAIRDKEESIKKIKSDADCEIYKAKSAQQNAEREAEKSATELTRMSFLYVGLLAFTQLCCAIANIQLREDFFDFFTVPFRVISELKNGYAAWLISLSDKMESGLAWFIRIFVSILVIGLVVAIIFFITALIMTYAKRWCTLSLKVLVATLAILSVFGEFIRKFLPINLILLFFLVQVGYLIILWYFDGYYYSRHRTDEWEQIQNR